MSQSQSFKLYSLKLNSLTFNKKLFSQKSFVRFKIWRILFFKYLEYLKQAHQVARFADEIQGKTMALSNGLPSIG